MKKNSKLINLLELGGSYFKNSEESILTEKVSEDKWSKKEILGHLIDSAINNLQRFTEVQFKEKPYRIRKYSQNELVRVNLYQESNSSDLIDLWYSLNMRIEFIVNQFSKEELDYEVIVNERRIVTLEYLIEDYINHLEHHLHQILE